MAHEGERETYTNLGQEPSEEVVEHNPPATRQAFELGQGFADVKEAKTQETNHEREPGHWDSTVRQEHAGDFVDDDRRSIFLAEKLLRLTRDPYAKRHATGKQKGIEGYGEPCPEEKHEKPYHRAKRP
jgi:hypothetical protein